MAKRKQSKEVSKPKIGRPRANRHEPAGPVSEEILGAAGKLFRQKGYAGTSTREIADAVGLRQPSLFHYFKNKNEIFRAVAAGAVVPVLEFIEEEKPRADPADVALYRLVRFDTYHLCTNENVLGSPFQFPELAKETQPEFWVMRDQIISRYQQLLDEGSQSGLFTIGNSTVVTNFLFSLGESTLSWYRNKNGEFDPAEVADTAADLALRSVLTDADRLPEIQDHHHYS